MVKYVMLLQSKEATGLPLSDQEQNVLKDLREKGIIPPKEAEPQGK